MDFQALLYYKLSADGQEVDRNVHKQNIQLFEGSLISYVAYPLVFLNLFA